MAKNVDADEGTNTIDPERARKIIDKIEGYQRDLLSLRGSYMADCKAVREDINTVFKEARAFGIRKKGLKRILDKRELNRKLEGLTADLEEEDAETFDQLDQALGALKGSPLGEAAAAMERSQTEAGAKKRGRPRKAPSAEAAALADDAAKGDEALSDEDDERDLRPPHLRKPADEDTEAYKAGAAHRETGGGCSIPNDLKGDDRDLWHSGWSAADERIRNQGAAAENAERLQQGISPLH